MQDAGYWQIPIYKRGEIVAFAMVDEADVERLGSYRWRPSNPHGYAVADIPRPGQRTRAEYMHRVVMDLKVGDGVQVDHINRNKLDNRRENLRLVGKSGNMQNMLRMNGKSRFRGVSPASNGRWRANVYVHGRQNHVGSFDLELDAAKAAEAFRQEHMPYAEPDPELVKALRPDPVDFLIKEGGFERPEAVALVEKFREAGLIE